ncbi:MAG TPA: adenylate/guanylate cyclase domain-containing protein [Candidatus Kryptonia bacterium]|nr:adenylate/guanylate cyclase domain-containing protein [Candidatus Kryptonia bacterium]
MIKLVLFIMDHIVWVYLGVLVSVGAIASQTSIALAVLLVFACGVALLAFLHNSNPLTPWLRERDDQFIFHACRSPDVHRLRRLYRRLPSDPRCRLCLVPFGGVGKLLRIAPSRKNPNFCTDCLEAAPVGAYEREVGVLFADVRGFTAWSEKRSPAEVADGLTRFYAMASRALTLDDALVEFVGDQVMALYLPDFPSLGQRTSEVMISAAERLVSEIDRQQAEDVLPVGVGIHIGVASVGNVGQGKTKNFTAVGDVVNTAARLQSCALPGQIVVSDEVYARAAGHCSQAEPVSLSLKGKSEPVGAHVIHAHRGAA